MPVSARIRWISSSVSSESAMLVRVWRMKRPCSQLRANASPQRHIFGIAR